MKKLIGKLSAVFFLSFLFSCSNYVFIYGDNKKESTLKEEISFDVVGDDATTINLYLGSKINEANNPKLHLNVSSAKKKSDLVTKDNQVVTVTSLQYIMEYTLSSLNEKCTVISKKIITESTYDQKSSGYSFGSDLSIIKLGEELIEENIEKFLDIISEQKNLSCKAQ